MRGWPARERTVARGVDLECAVIGCGVGMSGAGGSGRRRIASVRTIKLRMDEFEVTRRVMQLLQNSARILRQVLFGCFVVVGFKIAKKEQAVLSHLLQRLRALLLRLGNCDHLGGVTRIHLQHFQLWSQVLSQALRCRPHDVLLIDPQQFVRIERRGRLVDIVDVEQLAQLVKVGSWRTLESGTQVTCEGEPVKELLLICDGQMVVESQGRTITHLHGGSLVGELALVSGSPASATVTAERITRAFVLEMETLRKVIRADDLAASAVDRLVGHDLAAKLRASTKYNLSSS